MHTAGKEVHTAGQEVHSAGQEVGVVAGTERRERYEEINITKT